MKVEVPEVTQSEIGQKQKLREVLNTINQVLSINQWSDVKWNVDSEFSL